jgi:hypothetical protein
VLPKGAEASAIESANSFPAIFTAMLALLIAIPAKRLAAAALAELFSRRRSLERCAEALVRWARGGVERAGPK